MALFKVRRTIKPGVIPSGLTYGEMAVNITDRKLYVGGTAGNSVEILGGSGGAETTWSLTTPTTATDIAGIPQGTTFDVGENSIAILERILYPYQNVSFSNFVSGLSSSYELGQTGGNGTVTATWTSSLPDANWTPNSAGIAQTGFASATLLSGASPTADSASITYAALRSTSLASNSITVTLSAQQIEGSNPSTSATRSWWSRLYWGKSTNASLTDPSSLSLGSNTLLESKSASSTTLTASAGAGYFYIFIHDSYTVTSMTLAGFDVAQDSVRTVTVTNAYGFSTTYKVYRSLEELNGALSIITGYSYS
jgi:hypothetical protein